MSLRYTKKLIRSFSTHVNFKYRSYFAVRGVLPRIRLNHLSKFNNALYYSGNSLTSTGSFPLFNKYTKNVHRFFTTDLGNNFSVESIVDNPPPDQRILLLQCCGKLVPNKSLDYRIQLCEKLFDKFKSLSLNTEDYNTYIKVNTENEVLIDCNNFLKTMKCEPNDETYKLLLENVCEKGDANQAYEILSNIKEKHYRMDEQVFNNLVLCHTINDGYKGTKVVLNTMQVAQVTQSSDTNWNILIGLAVRNDKKEFLKALGTLSITYNEKFMPKLLLKLGLNNNEDLIKIIKNKFTAEAPIIEQICIVLIHRNKASIAVRIFCEFSKEDITNERCKFLLKEMLETDMDSIEIMSVCQYLEDFNKELKALEHVTEIALRKQQMDRALIFLEHFDKLRPHYFWPILMKSGKEKGEIGVIETLQRMLDTGVEIDSETMEWYILPFCDLTSPNSFLFRIHNLNIPLRQLVTPMMAILLRKGRAKEAVKLYNEHKTPLDGNRLIPPLVFAWKNLKDVISTVEILKAICESNDTTNVDFTGNILIPILKTCRFDDDYSEFLKIIEMLRKERLSITSPNGEIMESILERRGKFTYRKEIEDALYNLLDVSMQRGESYIPHPKFMSVDELECHLIELTSKNMETRGVLRKLIQAHRRLGNDTRVEELKKMLEESGYEKSAGMTASLMQTYISTKDCRMALQLYQELKAKHSRFSVDEYKLIDLAAVLVEEGKFDIAIKLLKDEFKNRTPRGGVAIERNCISLLYAAKNPEDAQLLFEFLTTKGFCQTKNIILGAVLKSYLKCKDLEKGVKFYVDCCKRYKTTPLQVELLKTLVEARDEELLKEALEATATVYGIRKARVSLAVVLADTGLTNALTKLLLEIGRIPEPELHNRCDKWVKDGKLESLLTLTEAASRIPAKVLEINIVYHAIARLYDSTNDVKGSETFLNKLKESDVVIPQKTLNIFDNLARRNRSNIDDRMNSVS